MLVNQADWPMRRPVGLLVAAGAVTMTAGILIGRYAIPSSPSVGIQGQPPPRVDTRPTATAPNTAHPTVIPATTPPGSGSTVPPTAHPAAGQIPGMPTHINEFGIPVGYPHTEAGAISACGNYVAAYSATHNREPSRIRAILDSISETTAVNELANNIIEIDKKNAVIYNVTSINDPKIGFNHRILGFEVQQKAPDSITISIWSSASFGNYEDVDKKLLPQIHWGTDICTVRWLKDDWKIVDFSDGPGGPSITERAAEEYQRFIYVGGLGS
ncbi:hypothetical protein [Frankia sp. CiP1_Cm_nod2]|uniref:hypothetical protein n=1 Tax=Frankia sp. CiP1_Cm_nod2 TaxID=2897161 RepID=UPI0020254777